MSPVSRPPLILRALFGLAALFGVMFAGALMWSDRAPGVVKTVLGPRARRLWNRVDARERVSALNPDELPQPDYVLHVALWSIVAFLVIITVWTWAWLLIASIATLAISALIEVGQQRFATTRTVEANDVMANAIGITVGAMAAALCFLLWSTAAAVCRGPR